MRGGEGGQIRSQLWNNQKINILVQDADPGAFINIRNKYPDISKLLTHLSLQAPSKQGGSVTDCCLALFPTIILYGYVSYHIRNTANSIYDVTH